jgi:hypothetical protein
MLKGDYELQADMVKNLATGFAHEDFKNEGTAIPERLQLPILKAATQLYEVTNRADVQSHNLAVMALRLARSVGNTAIIENQAAVESETDTPKPVLVHHPNSISAMLRRLRAGLKKHIEKGLKDIGGGGKKLMERLVLA